MTHELILLSPYRFPGQTSLTLAAEEMSAWLHAHSLLWHPAILWNAKGPPRIEAQYDHEQPRAGCIYAVPEVPPLYLPDDWDERVKAVGAVAFRTGSDRAATLASLAAALRSAGGPGWLAGLELSAEKVAPFFALGYGYLLHGTLAEAMEHENLLDTNAFWDDVQAAIADLGGLTYEAKTPAPAATEEAGLYPEDAKSAEHLPPAGASHTPDSQTHLQRAAIKLLAAREVLYPVVIHLLDICQLDAKNLDARWPAAVEAGIPCNVMASGQAFEELAGGHDEKFAKLKEAINSGLIEICGGGYLEREDPLLPLDSQLWNLRQGLAAVQRLFGVDVKVYARKRFGFHPQLPMLLTTNGIHKALLLTFDDSSAVPQYTACTVAWPSPDGKQVDAFVRTPLAADKPETFFNLAHYWFKTTREDHVATLAFLHQSTPHAPREANQSTPLAPREAHASADLPWYDDLMELARLAPLLGTWETLSQYFQDVPAGDFPSTPTVDDFHFDFLSERTGEQKPGAISSFASHQRLRRRLDAAWTLAALYRGLTGAADRLNVQRALGAAEDALERAAPDAAAPDAAAPDAAAPDAAAPDLDGLERGIAMALAERLQSRSAANQPGYLLLNPCAYARRLALELEGASRPLPVAGVVKACQLDGNTLRTVVEVPALGFAWIPREGPPGTEAMLARIKVGDPQTLTIRNEFFEVEVDAATGGLKGIRDHKTRVNRVGQRLVFNPGSRMAASTVKVTRTGPALGEIVSEGELVGEQDQVLASFRQRFRVWMGRPLLEMHIEIEPQQPPAGYPWHAYFGARFAWRDESIALVRGFGGMGYTTIHTRPQTPDYLELRMGRRNTVIFPGGLPFHQRHEGRMLDVILIAEGERATTFELGIALDREAPMLTAQGFVSPVAIVPTTKGPPHVGVSGWLFHLDSPNLLLTRMVPGALEIPPGDRGEESANTREKSGDAARDAITARILECGGHSGHAEFRCVRNPTRAVILDGRGQFLVETNPSSDAVMLEVTPSDLVHLQVEFS